MLMLMMTNNVESLRIAWARKQFLNVFFMTTPSPTPAHALEVITVTESTVLPHTGYTLLLTLSSAGSRNHVSCSLRMTIT
jgi:hypothetical protein